MKERSRISKVIACVAVLTGVLAMASIEASQVGKAVVRKVVGVAEYSLNAETGPWSPLKAGDQLSPGAVVRTAIDSSVELFLDKNGPLVKLQENTRLGIDKLTFDETGVDTVIETQLDLKAGRIIGITKKMSATSKYEVKTPNGVAGIRGTRFSISATGEVYVVDGSVVVVSVSSDGRVTTQVVGAGEMFVPSTGMVQPIPPATLAELTEELDGLVTVPGQPRIVIDGPEVYVSPLTGGNSDSGGIED